MWSLIKTAAEIDTEITSLDQFDSLTLNPRNPSTRNVILPPHSALEKVVHAKPVPEITSFAHFLAATYAPGNRYGVPRIEDYKSRLTRRYGWRQRPA